MVGLGVGLGVIILILDALLGAYGAMDARITDLDRRVMSLETTVQNEIRAPRKSRFRLHLMPLAVGMYLPFGLGTPILLGGIIAYFATRRSRDSAHEERRMHGGVLFGSGVIAGESLTAVGLAFLAVYEIKGPQDWVSPTTVTGLTVIAALVTLYAFWNTTMKTSRAES
jgi:hypothetical protein